jgi:carboxyl-terminal processing protease
MNIDKRRFNVFLPLLLAFLLVIGILLGIKIAHNSDARLLYSRADKLNMVLNLIDQEYVDTVSKEKLSEKAITSMLESLDPHSVYIPAKELADVNEPLEGNFSGIGVQFNMTNDTITVILTVPNGPSQKLGILPGDRIVKINDKVVAGKKMSSDSVVKKLKGPRGTKVKVTIKRPGRKELVDYSIVRDVIPLYSIDIAYMLSKDIGYVKINKFARTTHQEFVDAINKLHGLGAKKLVIDLRENGGGYLDAAISIADELLDNKKLIVYTEGIHNKRSDAYATSQGICEKDKVAVLIDEFSASASEILAGAIQDNDRGLIIGRRSFGKGLVQEQKMLTDGSAIRLTIARYYTPSGRCIQKPYTNGSNDYYEELNKRFEHGEFEIADSIKFAKTKKYKTLKGRTVYGGGGIMPDIFIPLDTTGLYSYLGQARSKGLIYKFAFDYTDKYRNVLGQFKNLPTLESYLNKQSLYAEFVTYASKNGLKGTSKQVNLVKNLLKTELLAYIARNLLDNEGFYPIISKVDKTLQKAVTELEK